ncbi:MAG TPA: response regulator, partial [Polyangiaceae bacterium]
MASRPERIVVIDDTVAVRTVIVRHLERAGFVTLQAADGKEGLAVIREHEPALVLCDLRMPNLDGLGLLAKVTVEFPELPVIVMSGEGLLADAVGALKLGAWDYIA